MLLAPVGFWANTVVLEDEFREGLGREASEVFSGVSGMPPSFLESGESFRTERDDGARPLPDPVRLIASAVPGTAPAPAGSEPGMGEGALEPLVAVAFRI